MTFWSACLSSFTPNGGAHAPSCKNRSNSTFNGLFAFHKYCIASVKARNRNLPKHVEPGNDPPTSLEADLARVFTAGSRRSSIIDSRAGPTFGCPLAKLGQPLR